MSATMHSWRRRTRHSRLNCSNRLFQIVLNDSLSKIIEKTPIESVLRVEGSVSIRISDQRLECLLMSKLQGIPSGCDQFYSG